MNGAAMPDEQWDDLSALLDGELDAERAAELRAAIARDPAAVQELEALAEVRRLLTGLGPVDPPFGFFERMLATPRRRRLRATLAVGAAAAMVASFVVLAGLTPVGDAIVPPVEALAQRHVQMAEGAPAAATPEDDFVPVALDDAAAMADLALPEEFGGMAPAAAYAADGTVHGVYGGNGTMVSLYEQPGCVDWSGLPDTGTRMSIDGSQAWAMQGAEIEVVVLEREPMVYTLVFTGHHDEMMDALASMPPPPEPSLVDRAWAAAWRVSEAFGLGG